MKHSSGNAEAYAWFACVMLITLGWIGHDFPSFNIGVGSPLMNPLHALQWLFFSGAALCFIVGVGARQSGRRSDF